MFFLLSKTLDLFLSPLTWAAILFVLAIPWRRPKSPARVRGLVLSGVLVLVVFSSDVVAQRMYAGLEASAKDTRRDGQVYDAVIVLGGAVDARPGVRGAAQYNDNVERVLAGFEVMRRGEARYAIMSGGALDADGQVVEGRIMKEQLVRWGIPEERVLTEERSVNTHENAAFVRPIVEERGFRRLLLVTSAYHMLRAEECFHAEGVEVDTLPVDFRSSGGGSYPGRFLPRAEYLANSTRALRELSGRVIYRARGYAEPRPLSPDTP